MAVGDLEFEQDLVSKNHSSKIFIAPLLLIHATSMDEFEIISKTFATHLEDYPIPRKPDSAFKVDLCTKYAHHERLMMCHPSYRNGEKRIIGINQPCYYYQYVAKKSCVFVDHGLFKKLL